MTDKSEVSTGHTPGPWSYDLLFINAPLTTRLATVGNRADGVNVALAEAKANCRLIASAPELLAACEAFLTAYDTSQSWPSVEVVGRARIALARVRRKGKT